MGKICDVCDQRIHPNEATLHVRVHPAKQSNAEREQQLKSLTSPSAIYALPPYREPDEVDCCAACAEKAFAVWGRDPELLRPVPVPLIPGEDTPASPSGSLSEADLEELGLLPEP